MKYVCLVFVLAVNALIVPIAIIATATPIVGEPLLVIAAPWRDGGADRVILDAGGALIGPEQAVIASMTIYENANFLDRLDANGALFVLNGRDILTICDYLGVG